VWDNCQANARCANNHVFSLSLVIILNNYTNIFDISFISNFSLNLYIFICRISAFILIFFFLILYTIIDICFVLLYKIVLISTMKKIISGYVEYLSV
jgi:hypothetical protein